MEALLKQPDAAPRSPAAVYAEQAVLGALIGGATPLDAVAGRLAAEDFFVAQHRVLFETLLDMQQAAQPVSFVAVLDRLTQGDRLERAGGKTYVAGLVMNAPADGAIQQHVASVREQATRRKVMKAAGDLSERVASGADLERGTNVGIEELLGLLRDDGRLGEPLQVGAVLSDVIAEVEARSEGVITAVATGFADVDKALLGGMRRGDLIVLAARPSIGKTSLAMQVADNVGARGSHVVVFTLEMSRNQLVERMLAQAGGVDYTLIATGHLSDSDYERILAGMKPLENAPIYIEDGGALTVQDIASKARVEARTRGPLSLIVVDYLQIMGYAGRATSRNDQLGEMSRALKALAKELDTPVLLLSQLNRGVEQRVDKRPVMSDLRESGAIEQDADVIAMMYRDDYYNANSDTPGQAELIIRKNRNGGTGTVNLLFNGSRVCFSDMPLASAGGFI